MMSASQVALLRVEGSYCNPRNILSSYSSIPSTLCQGFSWLQSTDTLTSFQPSKNVILGVSGDGYKRVSSLFVSGTALQY